MSQTGKQNYNRPGEGRVRGWVSHVLFRRSFSEGTKQKKGGREREQLHAWKERGGKIG